LTKLAVVGFSPMKITMFHQDFLQNFSGGDREVEPFSAGDALVTIKALGGFFPRKFIRFLSSFWGGSDFAYFKPREVNYFGYVCLKKKVA